MKQFIVLAAILPIMLVFIAQFSLDAVRNLRMNAAEDAIRAFCIEASYFDGGGPAEAEALRHKLAQIFRSDPREVYIHLTQTDASHIGWLVSFPVGEIMAGARFMGLSNEENRGRAEMSGVIVIAPPPPEPLPPAPESSETAGTPEQETPGLSGQQEISEAVGTGIEGQPESTYPMPGPPGPLEPLEPPKISEPEEDPQGE